jgi:acyl-coenzyme A thioesterase PaaI-like protein
VFRHRTRRKVAAVLALFEHGGACADGVGEIVVATDLSRGPWEVGSLHGGPVSAVLAYGVESHLPQAPHVRDVFEPGEPGVPKADATDASSFVVARLTIELERAVPPHVPLTLRSEIVRPGRKVQLVEATLSDDVRVLARAKALCIRQAAFVLPDLDLVKPELAPIGAGLAQRTAFSSYDGFHNVANEHRFVEGSWTEPGAVFVWIRLCTDLFDGRPVSPLQRVAAAADFGNGVSAVLPWENYMFINPDLTIHQHRPLVGEWVGMRTKSHVASTGVGFAESELFDRSGRIGRSVQSLLLESR